MNNIAPLGCFPSVAGISSPRGKCNKKFNKAISFYNSKLPDILLELQSQLPGFTFIHSDLYNFLMELRETGNRYGKKEENQINNSSCGGILIWLIIVFAL